MTVAVDSNVLLDILTRDAELFASSVALVREAVRDDEVIVCEVVCAELARHFQEHSQLLNFVNRLGISFRRSNGEALWRAGSAFQEYARGRSGLRCAACGTAINARCPQCDKPAMPRQHILADFMIGAHALVHAGRLLTRDRGYYRKYFPDLILV